MRRIGLIAALLPVVLTGCASTMSGLDGENKFACKAPEGVTCSSLSGVYANAVANNLPGLRSGHKSSGEGDTGKAEAPPKPQETIAGKTPQSGDPIWRKPRVMRVWIAPWEDAEGDLHDQSYVYVVADPGGWMVEHNKKRIIDRYRPTFIRQPQQQGAGQQPQPQPQQQQQPPQQVGSGVFLPGAQAYGGQFNPFQQPSAGGTE